MSTAFFKCSSTPQLLRSFPSPFTSGSTVIQVWNTTCVVTNFGKSILPILKQSVLSRESVDGKGTARDGGNITALINPGNPQLSGVRNFPYFPRGGPVPETSPKSMHKNWQPLGYVTQWGGMEVGDGMLYPVSVVDGLVHQLGGWKLKLECKLKSLSSDKCPVGTAILTHAGGDELSRHYDHIIHTSPPFFKSTNNSTEFYTYTDDPIEDLSRCYQSSIALATSSIDIASSSPLFVCCPLLGAGARGFPYETAIKVAAEESFRWLKNNHSNNKNTVNRNGLGEKHIVLAFGIPDLSVATDLVHAIEELHDYDV